MEKEFCSYEQALALKKIGFDEPCFGIYYYQEAYPMLTPNSDEKEIVFKFGQYIKQTAVTILAPLKQQVFRWFREKHNLLATVYSNASGYLYEWHDAIGGTHRGWSEYEGPNDSGVWDTYEEAESACIDKLIELIKKEIEKL